MADTFSMLATHGRITGIGFAIMALCSACGGGSGEKPSPQVAPTISLVAGALGETGYVDGSGSAARFSSVSGLAVDGAGNIYVADTSNEAIRKVSPAGAVTTLAGTKVTDSVYFADGTGTAARFSPSLSSLAIDAAGNLLVVDSGNAKIRKVSPGGVVTTFASFLSCGGRNASDYYPHSIAIDTNGNAYVNFVGTKLVKISAAGTVSYLRGAAETTCFLGGTRFYEQSGLAVDSTGYLYLTTSAAAIFKTAQDGTETLLAGSASPGYADGAGAAAQFRTLASLAIDGTGNLYAPDTANHTIRKISPAGLVTTVAGVGGIDGVKLGALPGGLSNPRAIAVDKNGDLYVYSAGAILKIQLAPK